MARISRKELEKATITQTKKDQKVISYKPDLVYYTLFGKHYAVDEEGNPLSKTDKGAYAKQQRQGNSYSYFVKTGNSGHLLNPSSGLYSDEENKFNSAKGQMYFKFQKVTKTAFDYYLNFLRTRNPAWLRHAEREI
jgi:hypothetical protein